MNAPLRLTLIAVFLLLGGCASTTHVMVGTARPAIAPDQVKLYTAPPAKFEQIATIDASSKHSLSFGDQRKTDKAIERMKAEAAKVGANGVLLQGVGNEYAGSIGTGFGSSSFSPGSAVGVGVGTSGAVFNKVAKGLAIYVEHE